MCLFLFTVDSPEIQINRYRSGARRRRPARRPTWREERGLDRNLTIPAGIPGRERPALVNVVLNRARPNGAAYAATLLGLAAGGHLRLTASVAGGLVCNRPPGPAPP